MADIGYHDTNRASGQTAMPASIHCLMIPLSSDILLLPNAAIAEVVSYKDITMMIDTPSWLLGKLNWREHIVPVVSFESAIGKGSAINLNKTSRVAVLNTLNGNQGLPYIGLLTQGIPHLQVVHPQALTAGELSDKRELIHERVRVNGVAAVIPDMDALEARLLSVIANHPS